MESKSQAINTKIKEPTINDTPSIKNEIDKPNTPSIHIDLQIHISPEATPEQIDQIFSSMKRHLY